MKTDIINGHKVKCYDDGKSGDRYTAVYLDFGYPDHCYSHGYYMAVGMSGSPFHPQGIGQHTEVMIGRHLGKRIAMADLPADCRKLIRQDMAD